MTSKSLVDQTGYGEPDNFIWNPPVQGGTKGSMMGPMGAIRGSKVDYTGLLKTKGEDGGSYRIILGSYSTIKGFDDFQSELSVCD